ncbi:MAG: HEPN domain-containing protein [Kiritimatiellia bacterium]
MTTEYPGRVDKETARAAKALRAATTLLEAELFEDAVSRAYYAVLHSAKAALAVRDISADTHKAVRRLFGLHVVEAGLVETEFAKILAAEQEDRELGDYEIDVEIGKERATRRVQDAEKFVQRIKKYLNSMTHEQEPNADNG